MPDARQQTYLVVDGLAGGRKPLLVLATDLGE
jgi:hypothetical protein